MGTTSSSQNYHPVDDKLTSEEALTAQRLQMVIAERQRLQALKKAEDIFKYQTDVLAYIKRHRSSIRQQLEDNASDRPRNTDLAIVTWAILEFIRCCPVDHPRSCFTTSIIDQVKEILSLPEEVDLTIFYKGPYYPLTLRVGYWKSAPVNNYV